MEVSLLASVPARRGQARRPSAKLAALALAPLLLLAGCDRGHAQVAAGQRVDCQVVLKSPEAGEVELIMYGDPLFATDNPVVRWQPASSGAPLGFILVFYKAPLADLGPFQRGGLDFTVPDGVSQEALNIVFTTPDGGRWAFRPDKVEPASREAGPVAVLYPQADRSDTAPLLRALSSAPSFSISVTAQGQERLSARFALDRAARDALLAKAGAMVETRDPSVCSPNHSHRR